MESIGQFFDPNAYEPNQGTPKHPVGKKFEAFISHTELRPFKDNKNGMMFEVVFTTKVGSISKRYSVEHENVDTVRIAREQLSALCFATDTFKISWQQNGFELRNKSCLIDVDVQKNNPDYNEVSMVYDMAGNAPRKKQGNTAPATPQAQPPQPAFVAATGQPPAPAFQAPGQAPQWANAPQQQPAQAPQQQWAQPQSGPAPAPMQPQQGQFAPPQFAGQAGAPMPSTGKPAWAQP